MKNTGDYQHEWIEYMPPKALALTAAGIFLNWRLARDALGANPPDTAELTDAMQVLWDELCELLGFYEAKSAIFHAPGMDTDLVDLFMEMVE